MFGQEVAVNIVELSVQEKFKRNVPVVAKMYEVVSKFSR